MKIIITGNLNYGLANSLYGLRYYSDQPYELDFYSRENGYNLVKNQEPFVLKTLEYDVFINNSALNNFNQTILLEKVYKLWKEHNKKGYIINIGSSADLAVKTDWLYAIEKKALKELSTGLSQYSIWNKSNIKITYIGFGSLETPKVVEKHPDRKKIELDYCRDTIKWLLNQPDNINISEIYLDKIQ